MIYTTDEKITSVKDESLLLLDFCKRLRGVVFVMRQLEGGTHWMLALIIALNA